MKWLLLLTLIFGRIYPAKAQIQHGTIGVVYLAKDKIVMAADSLGIFDTHNRLPNNSECKIVAPYGKMLFVSSGIGSYESGPSDRVASWSNDTELREAAGKASSLYHTRDSQLWKTMTEWTVSIYAHLENLRGAHPEKIVEAAAKGNGMLVGAYLGGINDNGIPILLGTRITYQEGRIPPILPETAKMERCPHSFCSIGQTEIVTEFTDLTSMRAKHEAETWKPLQNAKPADYDILRTMRLVELSIKLHRPTGELGGKIDAAELSNNSTVRWFAIKKNCQEN